MVRIANQYVLSYGHAATTRIGVKSLPETNLQVIHLFALTLVTYSVIRVYSGLVSH